MKRLALVLIGLCCAVAAIVCSMLGLRSLSTALLAVSLGLLIADARWCRD